MNKAIVNIEFGTDAAAHSRAYNRFTKDIMAAIREEMPDVKIVPTSYEDDVDLGEVRIIVHEIDTVDADVDLAAIRDRATEIAMEFDAPV